MPTTRRVLVGAAVFACAFSMSACNNGTSNTGGASAHDHEHEHGDHDHDHGSDAVRVDVYEGILGEISALPGSLPGEDMKIRHEHIPDFKSETGEVHVAADGVTGMKSMTMPFPLSEGLSLDGFSVGDKVRFSFRVNWGGGVPWELTAIERLPQDTEINYENAMPASTDQEP